MKKHTDGNYHRILILLPDYGSYYRYSYGPTDFVYPTE